MDDEVQVAVDQLWAGLIADTSELRDALLAERAKFTNVDQFVARLDDHCKSAYTRDTTKRQQLTECLNEGLTALAALRDPDCSMLTYEPPMKNSLKRFDFRYVLRQSETGFLEVKTVHPRTQDDWERYESAIEKKRFPDNVRLLLYKEGLGGELYHYGYSARCGFLRYSLETEVKISECGDEVESSNVTLVFWSDGSWQLDELEDFANFYITGRYCPGDPYEKMQEHYLTQNGVILNRTITRFSYMRRTAFVPRCEGCRWLVEPPKFPTIRFPNDENLQSRLC